MTYPLLDHCNRRNAAELARGDLDARPLMSDGWTPPTGAIYVTGLLTRRSVVVRDHGQTVNIGRGDWIHCGPVFDAGANPVIVSRRISSAREYNVCRPFDEAHMMGCGNWVISRNLAPRPKLAAYCIAERIGVPTREVADLVSRIAPPNHGHGAVCGCAVRVALENLSNPERLGEIDGVKFVEVLAGQLPKFCQWCADEKGRPTGRLICDDERAGRVSPSHAAGGYAEWQRRQLRITAVDWDAGIARFGPYVESK